MTKRAFALAGLLGLVFAAPALAEGDEAEAAEQKVVPLGHDTRAWLERQRSGVDQSRKPHGLTPPEEHRSVNRYLDSFTHPMPALFEFEDLGSRD